MFPLRSQFSSRCVPGIKLFQFFRVPSVPRRIEDITAKGSHSEAAVGNSNVGGNGGTTGNWEHVRRMPGGSVPQGIGDFSKARRILNRADDRIIPVDAIVIFNAGPTVMVRRSAPRCAPYGPLSAFATWTSQVCARNTTSEASQAMLSQQSRFLKQGNQQRDQGGPHVEPTALDV